LALYASWHHADQQPADGRRSGFRRKLIETWAGLHAARTALGFAATLVFLWALMHSAVREIRDVGFVGQLIAGDPQAPNVLEHSLTARLVTVTDNG
jgi:hypothetical protein